MSIYLGAILLSLAAFQFPFVSAYLFFHQPGNKEKHKLLGFIFFLLAISLADVSIRVMGIKLQIPALHFIDDGFLFLYGPLLYFYTNKVVYNDYLDAHFKHPNICLLARLFMVLQSFNQGL